MPKVTFFNLDPEKQKRVYQATLNEFIQCPLEEVSIKNIVTEAGIPRGSFYQYFTDKEDALSYLITGERLDEDPDVMRLEEENNLDIYDLVVFVFQREVALLSNDAPSMRMKLLAQISKSARAQAIFNQMISETLRENRLFSRCAARSNIKSLTEMQQSVAIDLVISALKDAFIMILTTPNSVSRCTSQLELKVAIIKAGVNALFASTDNSTNC